MYPDRRRYFRRWIVAALGITAPLQAQEPPLAPPPVDEPKLAPAPVATNEAPASASAPAATTGAPAPAASTNCPSLRDCKIYSDADARAYANLAWWAGRTCVDAIAQAPRSNAADREQMKKYYRENDGPVDCEPFHPVVRGAMAASIVRTHGGCFIGDFNCALQVMPSFTLGVAPFALDHSEAGNAVKGLSAIGGLSVRATPLNYWISLTGFLGTSTVNSKKLDPMKYPNPGLVLTGFGFDVAGGLLGLNWFRASLRSDGIFDSESDYEWFATASIDLTALGLLAVGAVPK